MEQKRLIWFNLVRVVVVSLLLVATTILKLKESAFFDERALANLTILLICTYFFSIVSLVLLKITDRFSRPLTYLQIVWDLFFVTALLLITGGISSPFSFLYLLSIINTSIMLSRRDAIFTASLSAILYGSILDLQYYGMLAPLGLNYLPARLLGANYVLYTIFVNIVAFYLTAFLTGYLAEQARSSESALQEKVVDYEELERLNSSIVASLASGLLTLNNDGKIRVFNRSAEQLTGLKQVDAYNRPLSEVIPGLKYVADDLSSVKRGELQFLAANGEMMTLGFNSASLNDKEGNRAGIIVNFQDLTHVKRIEAELTKADRLAAIGELSARIAHEIRNPLASISASVQLIAEDRGIAEKDRNLLEIVLRETDRLNGLITDFLIYARPTQPVKVEISFHQLVAELLALLATDPRFDKVEIRNNCESCIAVIADIDQLKQVLWNLMVNAADALPPNGCITIDARIVDGHELARALTKMALISVTDNGCGIDRENLERVFEPFFTTKQGGTGLGLATVYRIIEAHGGRILVDSSKGKGTTFTLLLPVVQKV